MVGTPTERAIRLASLYQRAHRIGGLATPVGSMEARTLSKLFNAQLVAWIVVQRRINWHSPVEIFHGNFTALVGVGARHSLAHRLALGTYLSAI